MLSRDHWAGRHFPLLKPDGESGGGGAGTEAEAKAAADAEVEKAKAAAKAAEDAKLGEAGMAALQKEREAREAAEKEAKRLKKIVDDAEAATKKREAEEAAAKGEFEKLATARQEEIDRLKAEIAQKEREALKTKVGNANKLPEPLIALLQGDDEKALEAHAKELAKHVKPPTAAETEAGAGQRGSSNGVSNAPKEGEKVDPTTFPNYAFRPDRGVAIPQ